VAPGHITIGATIDLAQGRTETRLPPGISESQTVDSSRRPGMSTCASRCFPPCPSREGGSDGRSEGHDGGPGMTAIPPHGHEEVAILSRAQLKGSLC
jgi:hypothetical protein